MSLAWLSDELDQMGVKEAIIGMTKLSCILK